MKPIIYQLLPRLFTNYNETRRHGGSIQENGCGTLNGITSKALRAIRDLGATPCVVYRYHPPCDSYVQYPKHRQRSCG